MIYFHIPVLMLLVVSLILYLVTVIKLNQHNQVLDRVNFFHLFFTTFGSIKVSISMIRFLIFIFSIM